MREIVLSPGFVQSVQKLDKECNIQNTVLALAKAIDELPCELAEDMIYHMLVTYTLGGRQLDQDEREVSLLELCRIREEKDDGFTVATQRWNCLEKTAAYEAMFKYLDSAVEMGMVLHTMENYLKTYNTSEDFEDNIGRMEAMKEHVKELVENNADNNEILQCFAVELGDICERFCYRDDYLLACAWGVEGGAFVIAFADLFILMVKEVKEKDSEKH